MSVDAKDLKVVDPRVAEDPVVGGCSSPYLIQHEAEHRGQVGAIREEAEHCLGLG